MPASTAAIIITVVALIYGGWLVYAVARPAYQPPGPQAEDEQAFR